MSARWRELCAQYLPVTPEPPFWRYSRTRTSSDPEQGWKLHIAATVLTANRVLEAVGPLLRSRGTMFKGPASLLDLSRINCGSHYGYALVGKCLTVYPASQQDALNLADRLNELTLGIPAPAVPFDLKFKPEGCVYYRYGAFRHLEIPNADGSICLAVRNPQGELVPDLRHSPTARPEWISEPLTQPPSNESDSNESPLKTTFRAFRALAQRGKGGVYQAFDLSVQPMRLCILKEGRKNGEPCWDGRDGYWRVKNEEKVLDALAASGIEVPGVYSAFEVEGNFYLATEFIEGESLQNLLGRRVRRISVGRALRFALQLATIISRIHSAGWVWRDCKPSNLMVTKKGLLRPLDFEGACPIQHPDPIPWGTPVFVPPEANKTLAESRAPEDLFALGVVIYLLLSGSLPSSPDTKPVERLRAGIPVPASQLVAELLDPDPRLRPSGKLVAQRLRVVLDVVNP
jgi:hypothetical protein